MWLLKVNNYIMKQKKLTLSKKEAITTKYVFVNNKVY